MQRLRRRLERDGFVVIEGALASNELDTLTEAVDEIWSTRANGQALHQLAFIGLHPSFLELIDHPRTLPLVCDVLGWNIFLYHCHLDVHPPAHELGAPEWRWHQDGGRQNVDLESPRPRLSVKVAYFLTSVERAEQGALWVIPGSHRNDVLARPPNASVRPPGARPLLVRAGSAVIFDRRLWHARGDNTSDRTRKALFYAYTYRWIRMRDDLPIDPALLARCDPVRRQLLGVGDSALSYWFPEDGDAPLRSRISA